MWAPLGILRLAFSFRIANYHFKSRSNCGSWRWRWRGSVLSCTIAFSPTWAPKATISGQSTRRCRMVPGSCMNTSFPTALSSRYGSGCQGKVEMSCRYGSGWRWTTGTMEGLVTSCTTGWSPMRIWPKCWPPNAIQFVLARIAGHTDRAVKQQTLPEALEYAWQGYSITGKK